MLLFVLIACAVSALFILKTALVKGRTNQLQWPPGPPAWPIIGHLHLLGHLPHQSLCNLSKLYGPLIGLRLGCVPTIIASSPDMAKAILQTHDPTFAFRPITAAGIHMYFNCANLAFTPYGPLLKLLRHLLASELLSSKRLESSRHVREQEVRELVLSLLQTAREKPHAPIELRTRLLATSNNIICRMTMGKKITEISSVMSAEGSFLSLIEEVMHLVNAFYVGDFIPWMAWLDPQGYLKRMKVAGQKAKALMQAVIDERRKAHKTRAGQGDIGQNNLLDVMLLAASQNTQENGVPITDDNIKGVVLDVFLGGSDTSSVTLEWALAELINNPKAMQKVQEELDRVVGNGRLVEEADIKNLPYLGMVVKETMRLHPAVPLLLPHEAAQECQIGGYKIPAKTRVYVNTWAIGRDPTIWERPLDFWPERFQNNNLGVLGQNFEELPFGSGRRRCPGLALGLLSVHHLLAALIQGFTWSLVPPNILEGDSQMNFLDMSERFGLTVIMAKPLFAFATQRLPLHYY